MCMNRNLSHGPIRTVGRGRAVRQHSELIFLSTACGLQPPQSSLLRWVVASLRNMGNVRKEHVLCYAEVRAMQHKGDSAIKFQPTVARTNKTRLGQNTVQ